jgi:hypothetical protein
MKIKPFYEWKAETIKASGILQNRYWYYEKYGRYCLKMRTYDEKA